MQTQSRSFADCRRLFQNEFSPEADAIIAFSSREGQDGYALTERETVDFCSSDNAPACEMVYAPVGRNLTRA